MKKTTPLNHILFYVLLALLPFNARYIFNFQQINSLEGFREHLTWSIYFFDIIFIILLIIYGFNLLRNLLLNKLSNNKYLINLLFFILIIFLSCLFAINGKIAFYSSTYLIGAILFFLVAKKLLSNKKIFYNSALIIFILGVSQSIIAIFQFISQKSIGLYLMGESQLAPHILGVAKFEIAGEKFIRAYGTFPHPNLLGAFLLFSLVCGIWLIYSSYLYHPHQQNSLSTISGRKNPILKNKFLVFFGNFLILVSIFFTFSRSVWIATFLTLLSFLIFHRKKIAKYFSSLPSSKKIFSVILLVIITFFIFFTALPRLHLKNCLNDQSYDLRKTYNQATLKIIQKNPVLGVGPGNFTLALSKTQSITSLRPWEIQPVHNLYLLIASEIGLIGLIVFIFFITKILFIIPANATPAIWSKTRTKSQYSIFFYLFLAYLFLGFFDHYFWTLPQGQMIFWLCLAFFVSSSRISNIKKIKNNH